MIIQSSVSIEVELLIRRERRVYPGLGGTIFFTIEGEGLNSRTMSQQLEKVSTTLPLLLQCLSVLSVQSQVNAVVVYFLLEK